MYIMCYKIYILLLINFLIIFKTNALPFKNAICENKGKIQNIIIGGIREPGHWFYPDVDKIYDVNDKSVLIINDFAIANPNIRVKVNNAALPILKESLACLAGSIHQIVFEHVGYGLQEKHFDRLVLFFASLLRPKGQIVYISYRVPFSDFYSQVHQRQEQRPMGLNFCRLLGIPEPQVIYKSRPYPTHHLERKLNKLSYYIREKVQTLLSEDSCYDIANDPKLLVLMKRARTILNNPHFLTSISPIENYLPIHNKILNCKRDVFYGAKACDIEKELKSFRIKNSPYAETLMIFENADLILQSITVERTGHVFAFKIVVQKRDSS